MNLAFENIFSNKIEELDKLANDKIHVRGTDPQYDVPADYKKQEWYVPFNEIPIRYCPTDRYSYLNKYHSTASSTKTWESAKGLVLDKLYENFIKQLHSYLSTKRHEDIDIIKDFQTSNETFINQKLQKINQEKDSLLNTPSDEEIINFEKFLKTILRYETQIASSILDYKISMINDININSTILTLFPFVVKPAFTALALGISGNPQPDFVFDNKIIIDVKAPPWIDDFYNTLGGYALVYEKANNSKMNLGLIVMPEFSTKRNVPLYFKSEIIIIDDIFRKGFLLRRNNLVELMKKQNDPGIPDDNSPCLSCRYFNHCWPSNNGD